MGNCQCKNPGDESVLDAVGGTSRVSQQQQHEVAVGKTTENFIMTTDPQEYDSPEQHKQQQMKKTGGVIRRSVNLVLPKLKLTTTTTANNTEEYSLSTPKTLPETPSSGNSSFAITTPSPQSNHALLMSSYGEKQQQRSRQHQGNNNCTNDDNDDDVDDDDEEIYYEDENHNYLDFTPISSLISAMDPTIKEEDSVLLDESIHSRSQSGAGAAGDSNNNEEPPNEEQKNPTTTFGQHASALIAATAFAAAAASTVKKRTRSRSRSKLSKEEQEEQEQQPQQQEQQQNDHYQSSSFTKTSTRSSTKGGGHSTIGRMQSIKMRIQAKSKAPTNNALEMERPTPFTMSALLSRSETTSTASTDAVKNKKPPSSAMSSSSSLHSSVSQQSQQTKSSMSTETMLTFHKLRLRAKVAARDKRKNQKMQKFEDRLSDVTKQNKLLKGFESIQQQVQEQEKEVETTAKDEEAIKDPFRMNLHKSQTWFFNFQGIEREDDFSDVNKAEIEEGVFLDDNNNISHSDDDEDNQSRQSAMSLLTCESFSSQKAYYAEKRRQRRDRKRANDDQCSQSDLSLLSGSSMDSQRKYFKAKQKQRQQKELAEEEKEKLKSRYPIILDDDEDGGNKKNGALISEIIVPSPPHKTIGDRIVLQNLDHIKNANNYQYDLGDAGSLCSLITEDDVYEYDVHRRNRKTSDKTTTCKCESSDNHSLSSVVTGVDSVLTDDWGSENDYGVSNRTNRKLAFAASANRRSRSHSRSQRSGSITRKSSKSKPGKKKNRSGSATQIKPHLTEIVLSNNVDKYTDNVNAAAAGSVIEDDDTSLQGLSSSARAQQRLRLYAKLHGIQSV